MYAYDLNIVHILAILQLLRFRWIRVEYTTESSPTTLYAR